MQILLRIFCLGFLGLLRPGGGYNYPLLILRSRTDMDMKLGMDVVFAKIFQLKKK